MRITIFILISILLSGCQFAQIATTAKIHPNSDEIKTQKGLLGTTGYSIGRIDNLPDAVAQTCKAGAVPMVGAVIWAPIATKVVMDIVSNTLTNYIKRIKAESSQSITFKTIVMSDSLINANCLALVRGSERDPSAVVIMKVINTVQVEGSAAGKNSVSFGARGFYMQPIFARLNRTVSLTKCTANCWDKAKAEGQVNLVVAVSGSAADGSLKDLGTGTTTIKELKIRSQKEDAANGVGAPTSLIALPAANTPVQLSISMADMGNVAGEPDIALGEVQAAMAALKEGAIAEVSAHYKD